MERTTFFDHLDAFLELKQRRLFTASVQATYFAILTEFYRQGFPKEIPMTVRELGEKAGLKSSETVHVAKNILKNNGLIDFQTVGKAARRTIFTLVCPNVCSNVWTNNPTNNLPNSESCTGSVCHTPAQAQSDDGDATLPLPPTPPNPNPKAQPEAMQASLQASKPASPAEDVLELWERKTGKKLEDGEQAALRDFDEFYGREIIKVAIATYVYKKGRTFGFFDEYCLKPLLGSLRGGEEDGIEARVDRQSERPRIRGAVTDRARGVSGDTQPRPQTDGDTQAGTGKGRFDDDPRYN